MNGQREYTIPEQMIVAGARMIRDETIIYVGVGLPTVAAFLAKISHAPNATLFFETGIVRTKPCLFSVGVDSLAMQSMADLVDDLMYVNCLAQRGRADMGFVGGGQIDRYGNINSTCIGDYTNPTVRFAGSGGGNDIASLCRNVVVTMRQKKQRFPEKVDFLTSPGYVDGKPGAREALGMLTGTGPLAVITDLGTFSFKGGEMVLETFHEDKGVTLQQAKDEVGWDIMVSENVRPTLPPTKEELRLLREEVDREGLFSSGKLEI
ncbi:MAG: CoA-transferase [Dehalococcoidia bacterium]